MLKARKRLAVIGGCAVLAGLAGPAVSGASAMGVFVSNAAPGATGSAHGCETAGYDTIQGALDGVAPGSSIKVCPGTFVEQLVIEKGVKISAASGAGTVDVKLPAVAANASGACATGSEEQTEIVLCTGESVSLTNLEIDARAPKGTCNASLFGIFVGGGATLLATNDKILGAGASPIENECAGGIGVQVGTTRESGQVGHAMLRGVSVAEYQKSAVTAEGAGSSVAVRNSHLTGNAADLQHHVGQNGVQIMFGASGSVQGSSISENGLAGKVHSLGILLYQPAPGVKIANDTLLEDDSGLRFQSGATTQPSSPEVKIVHSRFLKNGVAGLILEQGDVAVNRDTIEGGSIGIELVQAASQPFALSSSAVADTISGMSRAAVAVVSDHAPGDHPGEFSIKGSSISGNATEVENTSATFTVTRSHDN